ncbi:MAG: bacillithiol biosynthesis cysteine-adding enzyme BshC [Gemmatimonadota bacterium]
MSDLHFEPERISGPGGLVSGILAGDQGARALFPPGVFGPEETPVARPSLEYSLDPASFHCTEPAARDRLEAALAGEGLVVTTGQQPQLFGGPLYVLYKALSAVRCAARIEREFDTPCVAVFWVAADDHDWPEVASVSYLDREEQLRRLKLTAPANRAGRPVGPSLLPVEVERLTREFLDSLETREAGSRWLQVLRDQYSAGRSFTEAFIGVASAWMDGLPIAFLDSAQPGVRDAASPFVQRVLEQRDLVNQALERGTAAVTELGYRPQLTQIPGAIPLFREGAGGRYRLREASGRIQIDRDDNFQDVSQLVAEATAESDRFSPSAALRPVLESWLLPVQATVLGPGEVAYWSQLPPLFRALDVPMPAILPRDSWRVIEPRTERLLRKTGVSADELRDGGATASAGLIERSRPRGVEEALLRLEGRLDEEFSSLESTVTSDLPGLRSAVGKSRSQAFSALAALRKTLDNVTRDREESTLGQLRRAAANLFPEGVPQERALAVWVYLARYGDEFIDAARSAALESPSEHSASRADGVAGGATAE